MKKFLIRLVIFLSIYFALFALTEYSAKEKVVYDRYAFQYNELFFPKVKADIVIFGASASVRGVNPQIIENDSISVFNFGLNGSNPEFLYKWYTNYFKKHYPKPKLILLEVSWRMFDDEHMWRRIEQDSKYFPFAEFCSALYKSDIKGQTTILANRFHIKNRKIGKEGIASQYYNGYEPFPVKRKAVGFGPSSSNFKYEKQREYFKLLLDELKADENDVVLFLLPEKIKISRNNKKMIYSNIEFIKSCANQYEFDFFNYLNEFNSDTLFKDWAHLNVNGARQISQKIKADIEARNS